MLLLHRGDTAVVRRKRRAKTWGEASRDGSFSGRPRNGQPGHRLQLSFGADQTPT